MLAYADVILVPKKKKLAYPPRITGLLEAFAIESQLFPSILKVVFFVARFFFWRTGFLETFAIESHFATKRKYQVFN